MRYKKITRDWSYRDMPGKLLLKCNVCGKRHRMGSKGKWHKISCAHYKGQRKPGSGGARQNGGRKKTMNAKSIPTNFNIRVSQLRRLFAISKMYEITFSELFRLLIDAYVNRIEQLEQSSAGKKKTVGIALFQRHQRGIAEKAHLLQCSKSRVVQEIIDRFFEDQDFLEKIRDMRSNP